MGACVGFVRVLWFPLSFLGGQTNKDSSSQPDPLSLKETWIYRRAYRVTFNGEAVKRSNWNKRNRGANIRTGGAPLLALPAQLQYLAVIVKGHLYWALLEFWQLILSQWARMKSESELRKTFYFDFECFKMVDEPMRLRISPWAKMNSGTSMSTHRLPQFPVHCECATCALARSLARHTAGWLGFAFGLRDNRDSRMECFPPQCLVPKTYEIYIQLCLVSQQPFFFFQWVNCLTFYHKIVMCVQN